MINKFLYTIFICLACKLSAAEAGFDFPEITRLVKGFNFSSFATESTPQVPTKSEFEKWLEKRTVETVTPAAILTITRAACGFDIKDSRTKTGLVSVHSMMFLERFLRASSEVDPTLLSAVLWSSQMLRVMQCGDFGRLELLLVKTDIAPIKTFSKNMYDALLDQAALRLQNAYTDIPQGPPGSFLREKSPYLYALVWVRHLLNKPVRDVGLLIGFAQHLEGGKIHLDEQCRLLDRADRISHDEAAARVYRSTIGQNLSAFHDLALLVEDERILTDLDGRPIDFSNNANAHFEIAGDLYARSWRITKTEASLINLALLIKRGLYHKDQNGKHIEDSQRYEVEARLYRLALKGSSLSSTDRGIALNNLGLNIENQRTFEDADGRRIDPLRRMEVATSYYRNAIQLGFSEACNNLALAIDHGDTNFDEYNRPIDLPNRAFILAGLYQRSQSDVGCLNLARLYVNHPELLQCSNREKFEKVRRLIGNSQKVVVHRIMGLAYYKFLGDFEAAIRSFREGVRLGDPQAFTYLLTYLNPGVEIITVDPRTFEEESDEEEQIQEEGGEGIDQVASSAEQILAGPTQLQAESADAIAQCAQAEKMRYEQERREAERRKEENARRLALKREDKALRDAESLTVSRVTQRLIDAARRGEMAAIRDAEVLKKKVILESKAQMEFDVLTPSEQQKFTWLVEAIKLNTQRIGKPETLVHHKLRSDGTSLCTRRFTREDRLVYTANSDGSITIYGIRGHDETIDDLRRRGMLQ